MDNSVGEEPPPAATDFVSRFRKDRRRAMQGFIKGMFHTKQTQAYYDRLLRRSLKIPKQAALDLFFNLYPREQWRQMVYAVTRPLLYIVRPSFREQAMNLKSKRPDTWVEVFEDAGHALFVDEPDRFNTLLDYFIAVEVEHTRLAATTLRKQ